MRSSGSNDGAVATIVIPTFNRREFLTDVVAALKAQTTASFEAVFVDDGSTDDTIAVLDEAFGDDHRFSHISTTNRGPASARNVACRQATTEWLAFTDDDCIPQPRWLESLVQTAESRGADVVQGRTLNDPSVQRADLPWFARGRGVADWSGRYQTCNLLVRTSHLHEVGGFDETFPPNGYGEDTDLGLRLVRHGSVTAFDPEAVVHHRVFVMSYGEWLKRKWRWAQVVHLVRVNPDARSTFPHPYVAQRSHIAFWLALPATGWAAANGRWDIPALGLVGWVGSRVYRTRNEGRSVGTRLARGALELGGTAVESVAFAVESARQRCLLL